MNDKLPIYGFMHCCAINDYKYIIHNQWSKLFKSGLYNGSKSIEMAILGESGIDAFTSYPKKVSVKYESKDFKEYEFPTLKLLYDKCLKEECIVWYIHTKGVFNRKRKHPKFGKRDTWRDTLEHYTINYWKHCERHLVVNNYETCGPLLDHDKLSNKGKFYYYGGNFWWAKSSYIRTLENPEDCDTSDRWMAEGWLLGKELKKTNTAIDIKKCINGKSKY